MALAAQGMRLDAERHVDRAVRLDPTVASAQYAKLLLDGQGGDPAAVQRLARRLLKRVSGTFSATRPAAGES